MGLAVAEALAYAGGWTLHLLDLNAERGTSAASSLPDAHFHQTDVNSYLSLSSTFDAVFNSASRIDFVFANAGIVERDNFYAVHAQSPPPEPNQLSIDINLKGVVNTTYLAQHYFRLSPGKGKGCSLVMTASCGGLYPSPFCPMYTAAKHGVVGLMRAVAKHFWLVDGVRVNAICPGTVRTNLLDERGWSSFPAEFFTPLEKVVHVVVRLVEGGEWQDAYGVKLTGDQLWGRAVEVNGRNHYFREMPEYCDDNMRQVMVATDVDSIGGVLSGAKEVEQNPYPGNKEGVAGLVQG